MVHSSVQRDHEHLIAEAHDRRAMTRGVQGLSVRVARAINRALGRLGKVFGERFHARALRTPREVRLALRYVFGNVGKHSLGAFVPGYVDACSSSAWFRGFSRPGPLAFGGQAVRNEWRRANGPEGGAPVASARSWLLRVGLTRAGPIDVDDCPR
jgi:hypothetical protein